MAKNSPASPRVVRRGTARPAENRFVGLLGGQTSKFYHNPPGRTIPNRVSERVDVRKRTEGRKRLRYLRNLRDYGRDKRGPPENRRIFAVLRRSGRDALVAVGVCGGGGSRYLDCNSTLPSCVFYHRTHRIRLCRTRKEVRPSSLCFNHDSTSPRHINGQGGRDAIHCVRVLRRAVCGRAGARPSQSVKPGAPVKIPRLQSRRSATLPELGQTGIAPRSG